MKISKDKVVELEYELTVDGEIVDKTSEMTGPLDYIHGEHMLLPKFESELEGLEPDAEFTFTLSAEEGYGEYDPKRRFDIPKSSFEVDGILREDLLQIGKTIPLLNSSGMVVQGKIEAIKDDKVTMDFNHPMAGKTLNFKGKVISVRDATEKELTEGLHGEFLPPSGGCCHHGKGGCGCHKDGHDSGCGCHHDNGEGCCHNEDGGECCHHDNDGGCCNHDGSGDGCCCHHE